MTSPRRSGFALGTAVCMLAATGALAAASFFAVTEARRGAHRVVTQERAAAAADSGLLAAIGALPGPRLDSMAVGATRSVSEAAYVTRITPAVYALTAVGRSRVGTTVEAVRAHRLLASLVKPAFGASAAMVSRGDVLLGSSVRVSGADQPPPDWTGCPAPDTTTAAAIAIPAGRTARDELGIGVENARSDSIAGDSATYRIFGELTATTLAELADRSFPRGAMVSTPALDDRVNRVIHAAGDIVLTAARGQGILLVDGRLRIEGPVQFHGVIVAAEGIEATGTDVTVYGVVLSASEGGLVWRAGGLVQRSTCAIARAASGGARLVPLVRGAWSELF